MTQEHSYWMDQFNRPEESDLLGALIRDHRRLIERVVTKCDGIGQFSRTINWYGIPWRWTIELLHPDGGTLVFIIPKPGCPQIAVPLHASDLDRIPARRLSKGTREGILSARTVNDALWPEWELTSNTQVDELMVIIKARAEGLEASLS